ncbi:MAG: Na/Pi cotransporter family protein [Eubacterium sp.]|nr:Na/Pi cotransporter family protein [Eubacterium sp.]
MYLLVTELLSGLALFLFGMKYMSDSLQQAAGGKLRGILDRCTKNKYIAVVCGALFTAFIQSSGATTVMEVGFVNAGIMTLEQSVGITFGANIGTTITSQLVSLKLTEVAPFIIFIGAAILSFCKKPLLKKIAAVIFGFGALFLGINYMTSALHGIKEIPELMNLFSYLSNPFIAVLVGLVFTAVVQSSSVTVSVLVLLAGSNIIVNPVTGGTDYLACLYFILGANIGSCMPAVMAAMNTNRNAKRTALIHVMFNVIGLVVIGVLLIIAAGPIVDMIGAISSSDKRFVANADTIFKTFQCIILLPCSKLLVSLSKKIIHARAGEESDDNEMVLKHIDVTGVSNSATAVVEVVQEIERMADMVKVNLKQASDALIHKNYESSENVYAREKYIDFLSHRITEYMVNANRYGLPLEDRKRLGGLFHVVIDVERIGDHAVNIMDDAMKEKNQKIEFSKECISEMSEMFDKVIEIFERSIKIFVSEDHTEFEAINKLEDKIDRMKIECQEGHVARMSEGKCSIESGLIFTDLVIGYERIADHAVNIAYSILPEKK